MSLGLMCAWMGVRPLDERGITAERTPLIPRPIYHWRYAMLAAIRPLCFQAAGGRTIALASFEG
jgi:hypothetical protein